MHRPLDVMSRVSGKLNIRLFTTLVLYLRVSRSQWPPSRRGKTTIDQILSKSAAESGLLSEAKAEPHLQRLKSLISKIQERDYDTAAWNMKLKAKLYSLDARHLWGPSRAVPLDSFQLKSSPKACTA
ncbi:hypothetical protein R1sor_025992 [Riccia sorocarpa]|uniref:Uncharacterized protein n=1 Tax=Riccia sorocarpa TaxID=122646 RepID=A0ABD3GE49_9MARC